MHLVPTGNRNLCHQCQTWVKYSLFSAPCCWWFFSSTISYLFLFQSVTCLPVHSVPAVVFFCIVRLKIFSLFFIFLLINLFIFNGRILALQCCVGFCHTSTWKSQRYTFFFMYFSIHVFCVLFVWSQSVSCSVMSNSFVTPWTVTGQAFLSMDFSRYE